MRKLIPDELIELRPAGVYHESADILWSGNRFPREELRLSVLELCEPLRIHFD
jgi:hypothetical protein